MYLFFKSITYIVIFLILLAIHEFAHAVVSRKYNVNVPEIGVMFYFFVPFVYTNLTFTKLLKSKWQQLMCLLGGIFSNLLIAGICMGIACIDAFTYSVLFEIIELLNIALVLINLVIFFKLDGYYIFQLIEDESNLREKSIAYVKSVIQLSLNEIKGKKTKVKVQRKTDYESNSLFYFVFGILSIGYIPIIFICVALTIWNSIF
ncbi:site-2 protease family protein [Cellulosilyticum ruminicola]|uniref:site-2 protease family protein n=1 Tax=Cellulosilyticum ruminicola TaxID=425254 RepID=UPI0006D0E2D5|nr:site-2 protease family protein [Cellulosilyticum ruminicola]